MPWWDAPWRSAPAPGRCPIASRRCAPSSSSSSRPPTCARRSKHASRAPRRACHLRGRGGRDRHQPGRLRPGFDSIVSFNVLEHIADDVGTLRAGPRSCDRVVASSSSCRACRGSTGRSTHRSTTSAATPSERSRAHRSFRARSPAHRVPRHVGHHPVGARGQGAQAHDGRRRRQGLRPHRHPGLSTIDRFTGPPVGKNPSRSHASAGVDLRDRFGQEAPPAEDDRPTIVDQAPPTARPDRRRTIVLLVCVTAILGFYVRCSWTDGKQLDPAPDRLDFQNRQTDAILAGQLNLKVDVPPELLASRPAGSHRQRPIPITGPPRPLVVRRADLRLLRDRASAAPLPPVPPPRRRRPLTDARLPDLLPSASSRRSAASGSSAGGSSGRCRSAVRRSASAHSDWPPRSAGWSRSAGPTRWPSCVATSWSRPGSSPLPPGCCGRSGTATPTSPSGQRCSRHRWRPTQLGVDVGAAPPRPRLPAMGRERSASAWTTWCAMLVPVVAIGLALAWYNWARFGSPTEFGTTYMLLGENVRLARADELGFLGKGLFEYLLSPSVRTDDFPWHRAPPAVVPAPDRVELPHRTDRRPASEHAGMRVGHRRGVLPAVARLRSQRWLTLFIALLAGIGLVIVASVSFHFHSATMRYQMDYAPLLLLASVLGWTMFSQQLIAAPAAPGAPDRRRPRRDVVCGFSVAITAVPMRRNRELLTVVDAASVHRFEFEPTPAVLASRARGAFTPCPVCAVRQRALPLPQAGRAVRPLPLVRAGLRQPAGRRQPALLRRRRRRPAPPRSGPRALPRRPRRHRSHAPPTSSERIAAGRREEIVLAGRTLDDGRAARAALGVTVAHLDDDDADRVSRARATSARSSATSRRERSCSC